MQLWCEMWDDFNVTYFSFTCTHSPFVSVASMRPFVFGICLVACGCGCLCCIEHDFRRKNPTIWIGVFFPHKNGGMHFEPQKSTITPMESVLKVQKKRKTRKPQQIVIFMVRDSDERASASESESRRWIDKHRQVIVPRDKFGIFQVALRSIGHLIDNNRKTEGIEPTTIPQWVTSTRHKRFPDDILAVKDMPPCRTFSLEHPTWCSKKTNTNTNGALCAQAVSNGRSIRKTTTVCLSSCLNSTECQMRRKHCFW